MYVARSKFKREALSFNHAINRDFVDSLVTESQKSGWWRDVLSDDQLVIGLRGSYLNVYWQGQSLFRVRHGHAGLRVTTHEKFLIDPGLSGQVALIEGGFEIEELVHRALLTRYEGPATIASMKKAAKLFSGTEKSGCHEIAVRNSGVMDVEIAFPGRMKLVDGTERVAPRVDFVALERSADTALLVFWEAKTFRNKEIRSTDADLIGVIEQIDTYRRYIAQHRQEIEANYMDVAANFIALKEMGWARKLSPLVADVARGEIQLTLGDEPEVGLVVFGFDSDQREGAIWASHRERLEARLGRFIAVGNPKNVNLRT